MINLTFDKLLKHANFIIDSFADSYENLMEMIG